MKQITHNRIRQCSAGLLLLLFLQVFAFKLFHSHQLNESTDWKKNTLYAVDDRSSSGVELCAICDYQLAKDVDGFPVLPQLPTVEELEVEAIQFRSIFLLSFHASVNGRGPPAA